MRRSKRNEWKKRRTCLNLPRLVSNREMRAQVKKYWAKNDPLDFVSRRNEIFAQEQGCGFGASELKYDALPDDAEAVWYEEEIYFILKTLEMQVKRKSRKASGALVMRVLEKECVPKDTMVVRLSGYREYGARGGLQVARDAMARLEMKLRKKPKMQSGIYDEAMYFITDFGALIVAYCPQVTYNFQEETKLVMLVLAKLLGELLSDDATAQESMTKILEYGEMSLGDKALRSLASIEKVLIAVNTEPMDLAQYKWQKKVLRDWPEALIWREWRDESGEPRVLFRPEERFCG